MQTGWHDLMLSEAKCHFGGGEQSWVASLLAPDQPTAPGQEYRTLFPHLLVRVEQACRHALPFDCAVRATLRRSSPACPSDRAQET